MNIVIRAPEIIASGVKRKVPGTWRAVHNPLTGTVIGWQISAAALRYSDDHIYNISIVGTIGGVPVYVDRHEGSTYFFAKNCFLFLQLINGVYHIKYLKCVGHKKGEGTVLLYFAIQYLLKNGMVPDNTCPIVLEADYTIAEAGQFAGTNEERSNKLIEYYKRLGFEPVTQAKAHMYGLGDKPAFETTIGNLNNVLERLFTASASAGRRRRKTRRLKRKFVL